MTTHHINEIVGHQVEATAEWRWPQSQCTLVNRLRDRIEERDAFDLTYGVYDDLLPAEKEAAR